MHRFCLCSLGIRHAEELSYLRSPKISNPNERRTSPRRRRQNLGTLNRHNSMGDSLANNNSVVSTIFAPTTPKLRSTGSTEKYGNQRSMANLSKSLNSLVLNDSNLARTPLTPTKTLLTQFVRPVNMVEKCRLNGLWFDSSRSLMEQNTDENDLILLRFKYYSFYDLNAKVNRPLAPFFSHSRLRDTSRWTRYDWISCTNKRNGPLSAKISIAQKKRWCPLLPYKWVDGSSASTFPNPIRSSVQLQIQIQSSSSSSSSAFAGHEEDHNHEYDNTDIDQALERLQHSLLGKTNAASTHSLLQANLLAPSKEDLRDYLRLFKPRRFTWKSFKRYWFVLHETQLTYYSNESQQNGTPIEKMSLKGCEILPDVSISTKKYAIRLMIPSIDGMNETIIKCSTVSSAIVLIKMNSRFRRNNNTRLGWLHSV